MAKYLMAQENSRIIPKEDKIFGINKLAKEMIAKEGKENVVNATVGALLDDNGDLVVLSSVVDVLKNLEPQDYAEYAPIGGTPEYRKHIIEATFGKFKPKSHTRALATPGGTGAIRNTIENYTQRGEKVLTSDWFWAPYNTIAQELERKLVTYTLFDENDNYNLSSFEEKVKEILEIQDNLVVIINTPAHNPTGYTLTLKDWNGVIDILKRYSKGKKITILADVAYIDFAGDEDKYREFFPVLDDLPENILAVVAFSMSKGFTLYGLRGGAMICITKNEDVAEEFVLVNSFSARASWSNCPRAAMKVLSSIYEDEALLAKVKAERKKFCDMLVKRGKAFEQAAAEAGLKTVPFDSGFFISIPCKDPDAVGKELQKSGIFAVPLAKGLRISVASISEELCKTIPAKVKAAMS